MGELVRATEQNEFILKWSKMFPHLDGGRYIRLSKDSFLARRSNLHGKQLRAIALRYEPTVVFPMALMQGGESSWIRTASGDEVKDITANRTSMSGLYYDLLLVMERNMNFTSKIYTRRLVAKQRLM